MLKVDEKRGGAKISSLMFANKGSAIVKEESECWLISTNGSFNLLSLDQHNFYRKNKTKTETPLRPVSKHWTDLDKKRMG